MTGVLRWGRVEVTGGFLLLGALLIYLDRSGLTLWAAVSIFFHELGHVAALKLWGGRVALVRLSCVGVELRQAAGGPGSPLARAAVALAGPLASVGLAFGAAGLGERFYLLAGLSLGQGAFNLLPLPVLDGGRALEALAGRQVSGVLAAVTGLLLITAGVCLLVQYENPTLLLTGLWLTLPAGIWKREKIPCNWGKGVIEYRSLNKGWSSAAAVHMRKRDGRDGRYERL